VNPRLLARIGGALYLIIIVIGLFGELVVRGKLIAPADAMATAANIRAHESLWRSHIAAEMFLLICAVVLLQILYVLLRPVSRELARLALLFNVVSIGLEAMVTMSLVESLFPLGTSRSLSAFSPEQLAALASLPLKSHGYGFGVSLIFFGCFCIVVGYLVYESRYFPRIVGVLMQIAGVCYLINSFAMILSPPVANRLIPAILLPAFVGELSLCLWLLVKGVNVEEWNRRVDLGLAAHP